MGPKLYATSDLHLFAEGGSGRLPGGLVFEAVPAGLVNHWNEQVETGSSVLIPGDISDSLSPQSGLEADYKVLDRLPGQKVLSPGNHDSAKIWRSQEQIEKFCSRFDSLRPLTSGRAIRLTKDPSAPGVVVAAVMGAAAPGDSWFGDEPHELGPDSPKLRYQLELANLEQALAEAKRIARLSDSLIVQLHYPPWVNFTRPGAFSDRIETAGAAVCIYGHLHQESESGFEGEHGGTEYRIVAAPRLDMRPLLLGELTDHGVIWSDELRG